MKYKLLVTIAVFLVFWLICFNPQVTQLRKSSTPLSNKSNDTAFVNAELADTQPVPQDLIVVAKGSDNSDARLELPNSTSLEDNRSVKPKIIEFIKVDSELHQQLLEKLLAENSEEEVKNEPLLVINKKVYVPYVTDYGIEFYRLRIEALKQVTEESNPYQFQLDLLDQQLAEEGQPQSIYSRYVYQLLEQLDLADVQLVNLVCRGQMCLAKLIHPNSGINAVESFLNLIKRSRQTCHCKALHLPYDDFSESVFQFYFD